jgi:hypothetical protein
MALPETISVKLSSEDASDISITPVVVRDMPVRELIELMLGVTGKDTGRIHELLQHGHLVCRATRFRWEPLVAEVPDIEQMLAGFPDPDPQRPFAPERCVSVVLYGPGFRVELPREKGDKRRLLRKQSFWNALMEIAAEEKLQYVGYSYSEHADRYRMEVSFPIAARLSENAGLVKYPTLENHLRAGVLERVDFFAERGS